MSSPTRPAADAVATLILIVTLLVLAGCAAAAPAPATAVAQLSPTAAATATRTAAPAASPTVPPSPTMTRTPTVTRTPTARPTRTATATGTATATRTATRRPTVPPTATPQAPALPSATPLPPSATPAPPSATPLPGVAGRYPQSSCVTVDDYLHGRGRMTYDWCIVWVQLHPDSMEFLMSWHVTLLEMNLFVTKHSDGGTTTKYLLDEQGQRYPVLTVNGAGSTYRLQQGTYAEGSYFFPLPTNGARRFDFWDEDQNPDVFVTAILP